MAGAGNLYIVDSEVLSTGEKLAFHCGFLREATEEYLSIIDYLTSTLSGFTKEALCELAESLREYPSRIGEPGGYYDGDCQKFLSEVDSEDSFLY